VLSCGHEDLAIRTVSIREGKMRKLPIITSVMVSAALLACGVPTADAQTVIIELLNPPPGGVLELEVGESYTFDVEVTSSEEFLLAMATTDACYPGRGVFWHGNDRAHRAASATLHLTIKGKSPTADLPETYDCPEPGASWPAGVAPVSIVAGVRFKGGLVVAERFDFAVRVE
jgi:hypothetical protein